MKKFTKSKGLRLLAVVLVVIIVAAGALHFTQGSAGPLRSTAELLTRPFRSAITTSAAFLESAYGALYSYDALEEENTLLKNQVAELQTQLRDAKDVQEENDRLHELLGFQKKHTDFTLLDARVVERGASNWTSSFTLNRGSKDGLAVGNCVVTEYGALVGQISEVGKDWAKLRSIIDVDTNVGATVGNAGSAAILAGEYSLMQKGCAKLSYLSAGTQLLAGDSILTSGKGGIFPAGLLIGTVSEVHVEAGGQLPYGVVQPACDLDNLGQVFVILDFTTEE